ncbi:MAG: hypothetical protein HUK22_05190 [Thermoguttaceae bacterium]|nr:hypothetical protein [Thermoguttaceae bacterium]
MPNGPYPSGMPATSEYLNAKGLTAGVWFMPFSGNYDDPYFADKQDLFVKSAIDYPAPGEKNTRRYSNINQKAGAPYETYWGGTAFDMSNEKTREYVRGLVERITQDWNYKYIKIDGMWVGAAIEQLYVNDEYTPDDMGKQIFADPNTTNVENFRSGLQLVRDAAKGTFILGCNVSQNMRTLAASYGLVDAMRIGPDNGASWSGVCAGPWRGSNRYFYNARVWWNDPDPVYVRNSIPVERARVSASWASLTGQLYALSDWAPEYGEDRVDVVRKTIPNHMRDTVRPVDLFEADLARVWLLSDETTGTRRDVVGLFNWDEKNPASFKYAPEKLGLATTRADGSAVEEYVGDDFWENRFIEPFTALDETLPGESCRIIAVRAIEDYPILLSTSRHISQGILEVKEERWDADARSLTIVADVPAAEDFEYELRVYNPFEKKLERWTAPKGTSGTTAFKYLPDAEAGARFKVVE